jgi:hypothetical protein
MKPGSNWHTDSSQLDPYSHASKSPGMPCPGLAQASPRPRPDRCWGHCRPESWEQRKLCSPRSTPSIIVVLPFLGVSNYVRCAALCLTSHLRSENRYEPCLTPWLARLLAAGMSGRRPISTCLRPYSRPGYRVRIVLRPHKYLPLKLLRSSRIAVIQQ